MPIIHTKMEEKADNQEGSISSFQNINFNNHKDSIPEKPLNTSASPVNVSFLSADKFDNNREQNYHHVTHFQEESDHISVNDNYTRPDDYPANSMAGLVNTTWEPTIQEAITTDISNNRNVSPTSDESKIEYKRHDFMYITFITMALYETPERKLTLKQICEYVRNKFPFFQTEDTNNLQETIEKILHITKSFVIIPEHKNESELNNYWTLHADFEKSHFETTVTVLVRFAVYMEAINELSDLRPSTFPGSSSFIDAINMTSFEVTSQPRDQPGMTRVFSGTIENINPCMVQSNSMVPYQESFPVSMESSKSIAFQFQRQEEELIPRDEKMTAKPAKFKSISRSLFPEYLDSYFIQELQGVEVQMTEGGSVEPHLELMSSIQNSSQTKDSPVINYRIDDFQGNDTDTL